MKNYFEPEFKIVKFNAADVLAGSQPNPKPNPPYIDDEGFAPYM